MTDTSSSYQGQLKNTLGVLGAKIEAYF